MFSRKTSTNWTVDGGRATQEIAQIERGTALRDEQASQSGEMRQRRNPSSSPYFSSTTPAFRICAILLSTSFAQLNDPFKLFETHTRSRPLTIRVIRFGWITTCLTELPLLKLLLLHTKLEPRNHAGMYTRYPCLPLHSHSIY